MSHHTILTAAALSAAELETGLDAGDAIIVRSPVDGGKLASLKPTALADMHGIIDAA